MSIAHKKEALSGEDKIPTLLKSAVGRGIVAIAMASLGAGAASASSTQPAGINLGGTSFNDGFGILSPGIIYQQYFQFEHFNAINDANGNTIGKPIINNPDVDAVISVNQLIYVSPYKLFGGVTGMTALLPFLNLSSHFEQPTEVDLKANGFGVGDLTWGPFLQMPTTIMDGRPVFSQRFEFDTVSPIGIYNTQKDINQSSGFWSLNPYWAMTVLPVAGLEISARLNYLYNFQNNHPASSTALPPGTNYHAGQAGWVNFDASYTIAPGLDVGVNGYYFKQFTEDRTDGIPQHGSQTTNVSIGPGATYALNKTNYLFGNAYLPVIEKNTASGFHLVFRWVHVF